MGVGNLVNGVAAVAILLNLAGVDSSLIVLTVDEPTSNFLLEDLVTGSSSTSITSSTIVFCRVDLIIDADLTEYRLLGVFFCADFVTGVTFEVGVLPIDLLVDIFSTEAFPTRAFRLMDFSCGTFNVFLVLLSGKLEVEIEGVDLEGSGDGTCLGQGEPEAVAPEASTDLLLAGVRLMTDLGDLMVVSLTGVDLIESPELSITLERLFLVGDPFGEFLFDLPRGLFPVSSIKAARLFLSKNFKMHQTR